MTEELTNVFQECRIEDWDGYGARKVEDAAYLRARNLLLPLLKLAPSASASLHGSLTLE